MANYEEPCDLDLELEILGYVINNDKLIKNMIDLVKPSMFSSKKHKEIYIAILYFNRNNEKVTLEKITTHLKNEKKSEECIEYVYGINEQNVSVEVFEERIDKLIDVYHKRVIFNEAKYIVENDLKGIASQNLVGRLTGAIENMGITNNIEYEKFEDYIDEWLKYQEDETPIKTIKTGFKLLDDIVLLENSNLMIIGARPSVGKSAYATNLVKNFCLQGKHPLFVSLEMNKKEFMNRLVSNMAHIQARKLKRKEHKTTDEWKAIMSAKEKISKFKFNFYDKGGMEINQLYGLARYLKKKGELDVLVIDYLQLLETKQYRNQKQNQVSFISQKLKQLAMELDIPVIALAQLSRAVVTDSGKPREPQLSDLRDSGSLEQDANIVLMLHTDDVEQKFQDKKYIKLFVRKNRDGRLGLINYTYYGDFIEFVEKKFDTLDPRADRNGWVEIKQDRFDEPNIYDIDPRNLPF